jgi:hypothetical protein
MTDELNIPDAKKSLDDQYFMHFITELTEKISMAMAGDADRKVEMAIHAKRCFTLDDVNASPYLKEVIPQFEEQGITLKFIPYHHESAFFLRPDVKCIASW